jgi:hypothetical protein
MDEREIIYEDANDKKLFDDVNNYTKYKLVEMLIERHNNKKLKLDNLNSIEDLADDILKTLSIAGMKFYSELKQEFK